MARIGLPADRMADEALLAGLSTGGPDVGLAFVRRFQRQIFGVALAVVGDHALAEDVAQQVFERAWRRADTFDPHRGSVRAWLTTIAHNLAIDAVRLRKPSPIDPTDLIRLLGNDRDGVTRDELSRNRIGGGGSGGEPELQAERNESVAELRAAIRRLPIEQARAVVMAGIYGMTAEQVAAAEHIPLGTAKTRIRTAMIRLRAALVVDREGARHG